MTQPTKPESDAGYLEAATRIIFMGGLNRHVVEGKWPGFRRAFCGFDIDAVAKMSEKDIDRLAEDDRVIKYRKKLAAVVDNAEEMKGIAKEHGSFGDYVDDLYEKKSLEKVCKELARRFSYISEEGAKHWLYSTGYDVGEVSKKVEEKYAPFET